MEPLPIINHLPPQNWFDAENVLPQFISADHEDAFTTYLEASDQHWTDFNWEINKKNSGYL